MKTLLSILIVLIGILVVGTNVATLDSARSYAQRSVTGLEKLERAVSDIRSFRQENGRYPTDIEINCTHYKAIEFNNDICIQTVFLQAVEDQEDFIITYKSIGMPFSGKTGSAMKRTYIYNTKTQAFNYAHSDTYAEVMFWHIGKILIGLILIFLPTAYTRFKIRARGSSKPFPKQRGPF